MKKNSVEIKPNAFLIERHYLSAMIVSKYLLVK